MTYFKLNKDRAKYEQFVKNLYLVTFTAICCHIDSGTCPGSVPMRNYSSEAGSFGII